MYVRMIPPSPPSFRLSFLRPVLAGWVRCVRTFRCDNRSRERWGWSRRNPGSGDRERTRLGEAIKDSASARKEGLTRASP